MKKVIFALVATAAALSGTAAYAQSNTQDAAGTGYIGAGVVGSRYDFDNVGSGAVSGSAGGVKLVDICLGHARKSAPSVIPFPSASATADDRTAVDQAARSVWLTSQSPLKSAVGGTLNSWNLLTWVIEITSRSEMARRYPIGLPVLDMTGPMTLR